MCSRCRYPLVPTGYGTQVAQTDPEECPNGHLLKGNMRRSFRQCSCSPEHHSHAVWYCRTCGAAVYDPPHDETTPPTMGSLYG